MLAQRPCTSIACANSLIDFMLCAFRDAPRESLESTMSAKPSDAPSSQGRDYGNHTVLRGRAGTPCSVYPISVHKSSRWRWNGHRWAGHFGFQSACTSRQAGTLAVTIGGLRCQSLAAACAQNQPHAVLSLKAICRRKGPLPPPTSHIHRTGCLTIHDLLSSTNGPKSTDSSIPPQR